MGLFDEVRVPCPNCRTPVMFQSKGAAHPCMRRFELSDAPDDVLSNVNRHAPHLCESCGCWFGVNQKTRKPLRVVAQDIAAPDNVPLNDWYEIRLHDDAEER